MDYKKLYKELETSCELQESDKVRKILEIIKPRRSDRNLIELACCAMHSGDAETVKVFYDFNILPADDEIYTASLRNIATVIFPEHKDKYDKILKLLLGEYKDKFVELCNEYNDYKLKDGKDHFISTFNKYQPIVITPEFELLKLDKDIKLLKYKIININKSTL
jgi:hypothetical protein